MSQIAKSIAERPQQSLLSNMEVNPWESLKAITFRSGKELPYSHEKQPEHGSVEMRKESELSGKEKKEVDYEDVTKGKR